MAQVILLWLTIDTDTTIYITASLSSQTQRIGAGDFSRTIGLEEIVETQDL